MTQLDRDIRAAILRVLIAANGPMPESAVKQHLKNLFSNVAFTDADLSNHIRGCEAVGMISGTNDDVVGLMWDLTPKGKIRAQQLR